MYNVPPKFKQLCRLCLSVVDNDSDAKLAIFNNSAKLNKCKRRNELSISATSSDKKNSKVTNASSHASVSDDDDEITADDSQDISKRILTCLQLKVVRYLIYIYIYMFFFLYAFYIVQYYEMV